MTQDKALELAKNLYETLYEEPDPYIRLAALKACIVLEEATLQSEATKELMRKAISNMMGEQQYNS